MSVTDRIRAADAYLNARTGHYELRCQRYDAALDAMHRLGLDDDCTVVDVGSGWGEFGVRMHSMPLPWVRARYIPVDACIDGTDLDAWTPPRKAEYFVALEVVEHLTEPLRLLRLLRDAATRGVIVSTPNPATTDVLGMDATHRTEVWAYDLLELGFAVERASFYGTPDDSLLAVWSPRFL